MDPPDSHTGLICTVVNAPFQDVEVVIPVTLIIGGKGYTEEEVKAILQAMLDDPFFMNGGMDTREGKIMHIAKAHGITL